MLQTVISSTPAPTRTATRPARSSSAASNTSTSSVTPTRKISTTMRPVIAPSSYAGYGHEREYFLGEDARARSQNPAEAIRMPLMEPLPLGMSQTHHDEDIKGTGLMDLTRERSA